jgi:(2Fe-2S) ferredoxin
VRERFKATLKARGLSKQIRANSAGCLDACEYGVTAVVYPDAVWYGGLTVDDVEEIVQSHLIEGRPVDRLRIPDRRYTPLDLLSPGAADDTSTTAQGAPGRASADNQP